MSDNVQQQAQKLRRATKTGVVLSNKMNKTIVVSVDRFVRHPLYKKIVRRTSTFMAHDEGSQCKVGDRVRIAETRPLSKLKRWRVLEVIAKAR